MVYRDDHGRSAKSEYNLSFVSIFGNIICNQSNELDINNLLKGVLFWGHVYIHDMQSTENMYALLKRLPDGEYYYEGAVCVKLKNGKEKLIFKTKAFTGVVGKGLYKF